MRHRPLSEIAAEIQHDWMGKVHITARRYLDELGKLDLPAERFHADAGIMLVTYFLASAKTWHGPVARRIKLELREIVRGHPSN